MTVVINKHRNSLLMMHHYPALSSVVDCLKQIYHVTRPIRSTTQIWVVMSLVMEFLRVNFSDITLWGNHWLPHEMSRFFPG